DPGDHARGRRLSVIAVVRDQQPDLLKIAPRVEQEGDALAGGQLPLGVLTGDALRAAALAQARGKLAQRARTGLQAGTRLLRSAHRPTASRSRPCSANHSRT